MEREFYKAEYRFYDYAREKLNFKFERKIVRKGGLFTPEVAIEVPKHLYLYSEGTSFYEIFSGECVGEERIIQRPYNEKERNVYRNGEEFLSFRCVDDDYYEIQRISPTEFAREIQEHMENRGYIASEIRRYLSAIDARWEKIKRTERAREQAKIQKAQEEKKSAAWINSFIDGGRN